MAKSNRNPDARAALVLWLAAIGLSLGPAVSNGFARFAYGLLLPAMRSELEWSYAEAGWLNTANAIGYLIGALLSLMLISSLGARRLFFWGMIVTAVSLFLTGLVRDIEWLSVLRIVSGISGAPVFIAGGTLAAGLFKGDVARNAMAIAVYFGGGGLGQLVSGATLPILIDRWGAAHWPEIWLILGLASAVAIVPAWLAIRVIGEEKSHAQKARTEALPYGRMIPGLGAYFLFGFGYLIYLTFLVAWMRAEGAGPGLVALVWSLMGFGTMLSPFLWSGVLARSYGGGAMAAASLATGVGVLCALVISAPFGVILSASLVGLSFYIVPTAATNFGRKNFAQVQWGRSFAAFTIVFSVGQMIGPIAAGALADATESIALGLAGSGVVLLLSALVAVLQAPLKLKA